MAFEPKSEGSSPPSGHGRFAGALRRLRGQGNGGAAKPVPSPLPARTASAGTRRPVMRSADALPPPPVQGAATGGGKAAPPSARAAVRAASAKIAAAARQPSTNTEAASSGKPPLAPPSPTNAARSSEQVAPRWNWTPVLIGVAVLCWIVALSMLFNGSSPVAPRLSSPRLTFVVVWIIASMVTFVPLEFRLGLPGLTIQGVAGWTFLGYLMAFAPAPTGWLLDLPDLPVYLLFFLALFYSVSAAMLPLTVVGGRRFWAQRLLQLDMRRARRQSYELGLLVVGLMALAGLRVLTPLTGFLFLAVMVLIEILLLSQVAPEG